MVGTPDAKRWDDRYRGPEGGTPVTCQALHDYRHLLPPQGRALDLACGRGGNALLLARHGLESHGWDCSPVALEQLAAEARRQGVTMHTKQRDVVTTPPPAESFDVIVVSRFLHRSLCPAIAAALRPGGLLFYQTFTRKRSDPECGPRNPDYLLECNELLRLFAGLEVVAYREEGTLGDTRKGLRNEAMIIARHPQ